MKTLLILFWPILSFAQNDTITRFATYNYMEVFNHKTQCYEKFNKVQSVSAMIVINPNKNEITFTDNGNKYYKVYDIQNTLYGIKSITYECIDRSNERKCEFVFADDKSLTVIYGCEPIIYRVKNQ